MRLTAYLARLMLEIPKKRQEFRVEDDMDWFYVNSPDYVRKPKQIKCLHVNAVRRRLLDRH